MEFNGYYYPEGNYYNWCNYWNCCNCCNCHDCCHHKPAPPKKHSANMVNTRPQTITTQLATPVTFNSTVVLDANVIKLEPPNTIQLKPGRYLVSYYLTIKNINNESDTYNAHLRLNNTDLIYTTSKVRLTHQTPDNLDFIGNLSKTNLIEVSHPSDLQLILTVTDPIGVADAHYQVEDASIVLERIH